MRVGGERSTPRTTGTTGLPVERTTMFLGLVSSVRKRSFGLLLERNSLTVPVRLIISPTLTDARIVVEDVKTFKP